MFNTYCFSMANLVMHKCLSIMLYTHHCLPCWSLLLFIHYLWFSSSYFSVNAFSYGVCSYQPSERNGGSMYWILETLYFACECVCVCKGKFVPVYAIKAWKYGSIHSY
jgi:hypothetical protein